MDDRAGFVQAVLYLLLSPKRAEDFLFVCLLDFQLLMEFLTCGRNSINALEIIIYLRNS